MTAPLSCDDVRRRLPDWLDGSGEEGPEAGAALEAHVAACPACERARARQAALLGSLSAPWAVSPPPADLVERARRLAAAPARAAPASPRALGRHALARHALTFVAGVLVGALLLRPVAPAPPDAPGVPAAGPAPIPPPAEADVAPGPVTRPEPYPSSGPLFAPRRLR